jgi:hypothetical protein
MRRNLLRRLSHTGPLLAIAMWCLATCGCTTFSDYLHNGFKVGPQYLKPPAPIESNWIDVSDQRLRSDEDELDRWWTVFNDPTLN